MEKGRDVIHVIIGLCCWEMDLRWTVRRRVLTTRHLKDASLARTEPQARHIDLYSSVINEKDHVHPLRILLPLDRPRWHVNKARAKKRGAEYLGEPKGRILDFVRLHRRGRVRNVCNT